eukprot:TRINITY_DN42974_c0_g1_i1.p1 TRINITY_DN42974_c0_g1~~TRINITY_DN42974_c0_g1_i1.p1  ORF type:complete len:504 (+),score=105.36 TRINITY_DN42974_c0_g1_i1:72-1583(+)
MQEGTPREPSARSDELNTCDGLGKQMFPAVIELWNCMGELYPEPAPEDRLLRVLLAIFEEVAPSAHPEMCDLELVEINKSRPGFSEIQEHKHAETILNRAGWSFDGEKWQQQDPIPFQLIRAADHFVKVKLGVKDMCDSDFELPTACDEVDEDWDAVPDLEPAQVDAIIEKIRGATGATVDEVLPDRQQMVSLCKQARGVFRADPNILLVPAPAVLIGDIHGQFWDLRKILDDALGPDGLPGGTTYVFLGDYVDRGKHSLLCLALILALKVRYPDRIVCLRGNHESRITNQMYGFFEECIVHFPTPGSTEMGCFTSNTIWLRFNRLFDSMPLAAIVGDRIFCCHGGLSPQLRCLERILTFDRDQDIVPPGIMSDLTWSDPGQAAGYCHNARGSGCVFGEDVSAEFLQLNNLQLICRAHQCVKDGYKYDHGNRVVTVFSAPNYCGQQNMGAIMKVTHDLKWDFEKFEATQVEGGHDEMPGHPGPYFVQEAIPEEVPAAEADEQG